MDQIDWHECHPRRLAKWAARALAAGACIRFPGVTVRAARDAHHLAAPAVLVPGLSAAIDWAPALGDAGRRIARRLWPGPAVLVTREGVERGLASRLPAPARDALGPALRLRTPTHDSLKSTLARARLPLACADAGDADVAVVDHGHHAPPAPVLTRRPRPEGCRRRAGTASGGPPHPLTLLRAARPAG